MKLSRHLLGCDAVYSGKSAPTFRRNLPLSSFKVQEYPAGRLFGILFDSEDGDSAYLQNVSEFLLAPQRRILFEVPVMRIANPM
jgi:hypothetical protein